MIDEPAWQKQKRRVWFVLAAVLGAIAAVSIIFLLASAFSMFREMRAARESLRAYSDALISKNYSRAYSLRSAEFQRVESESEFEEKQRSAVSKFGALREVVLDTAQDLHNQNGWTCIIHGRVVYEKTQFPIIVRMKEEGDRWLMFDYRASAE